MPTDNQPPASTGGAHLALAELQELAGRLNDTATRFVADFRVDLDNVENERVFGEHQILERIALLAEQTTERIDTFSPGVDYPIAHIDAAQRTNSRMFERGVKSRGIYLSENLKFPKMLDYFEWTTAQGANLRLTLEVPVRMIIADQKTALLPLDITDGMNGILIVKVAGTIQALCALFETYWAAAQHFRAANTASESILNEKDIQVLHLLAKALTDQQIGRRMGFGTRTASSAVETVRRKLGARNRFELGVIAAKEGWL